MLAFNCDVNHYLRNLLGMLSCLFFTKKYSRDWMEHKKKNTITNEPGKCNDTNSNLNKYAALIESSCLATNLQIQY